MAASRRHPTLSLTDLTFDALGLPQALTDALARAGIDTPMPIQAATLPDALDGADVLGRGRTGSGKTLAFVLPILTRLAAHRTGRTPGRPRALILAPTRELAAQIDQALTPLGREVGIRSTTVYGGASMSRQISALRQGVDVVVACPGRLLDLISQGAVSLANVEITVLDEADHMADLGFLPDVRKILDLTPPDGQRLLFSATLDAGIGQIVTHYLHDPVTHEVDPEDSPVADMDHHVLHINAGDRMDILVDLASAPGRSLIFTRTKHGATKLAQKLTASGVPAVELHGNLTQAARQRNLARFASGQVMTLVATDVAARGIHVDDIRLVIHADPSTEHKAYLHRSGRTARAGATGTVVTLMTDGQVGDVRKLVKRAGINATTTKARPGHPVLATVAPGERIVLEPAEASARVTSDNGPSSSRSPRSGGQGRPGRSGRPGQRRHGDRASSSDRSGSDAGPRRSTSHGSAPSGSRSVRAGEHGQSRSETVSRRADTPSTGRHSSSGAMRTSSTQRPLSSAPRQRTDRSRGRQG